MSTYVAFLRAINLGAKRQFPKAAIIAAVEGVGFTDVQTHINTGNVRFDTRMRSVARIREVLEKTFLADRGFEVPAIVFPAAEFAELAREARALSEERPGLARHYVYLLAEEPSAATARAVEATSSARGEMLVRGRAVHALLRPGYQDGVVDPLGAARLLPVATNRNLTVVTTIAQKWC